MLKDPFYRQITAGLNGLLDPQVFERCMGDLLRPEFPGLVPVSGGSDSGTDGAIPDGNTEPFPLVCTTGKDVIGNLTRSLDSRLKLGRSPEKIVLATSRRLTPKKRFNLEERARSKGFRLIQIFEQDGIADRLYRNSRWCKELLGLPGLVPALSVVPLTRRPLIDIEPVGRGREIEWLHRTRRDRVLSGEPGSGKTFLLYYLIRHGWNALFLESSDETAIRNAICEQQPNVVIFDDAHTDPDRLARLVRLRKEMAADFEIVATTWEGGRDQVVEAMGGISEGDVCKLGLLTRDEILKVIQLVGVRESNEVMRYLVDQASNKPGLAVTLARLWLQGSWEEVIEGKALSRTLLDFFRRVVGPDAVDILACFSLGGDRGMGFEPIREFLDLDRARFRQSVIGLSAGGVFSERGGDALAVWPRQLRFSLLRSVFFPDSGVRVYRFQSLLEKSEDIGSAIETIIAANVHGAFISAQELRELVKLLGSTRAWGELAFISEESAKWVLINYPGDLVYVARETLHRAPKETIRFLLERAVSASGSTHSHPNHPMRILEDWVKEISVSEGESVRRRYLLARIAKRYLAEGGVLSVGIHGICLALNPSLEGGSLDPGAGRTYTFSWGRIGSEAIREVGGLWEEIRDAITDIDEISWPYISSMLWHWICPKSAQVETPKELEDLMHLFARKMLLDLALLARTRPGLAVGLNDIAKEIGLDLQLESDPDFEVLYPGWMGDVEDFQAEEIAQRSAVKTLVSKWIYRVPSEVAAQVVFIETEAKRMDRCWPRWTPYLCQELAKENNCPDVWLNAFIEAGVPGDLVIPFMLKVVDKQQGFWMECVERCLSLDQYWQQAAEVALRLPYLPMQLCANVLQKISSHAGLIESLALRKKISLENLRHLLQHSDWRVALSAAEGEWLSSPSREVRPEIAYEWRNAILSAGTGEWSELSQALSYHWLSKILVQDADLAEAWLRKRLQDRPLPLFISKDGPFASAVSVLSRDRKIDLLQNLSSDPIPRPLASLLVGHDPEVFRVLLRRRELERCHFEPLARKPDGCWLDLALLAIEEGWEPRAVAEASFRVAGIETWWGSEVMRWTPWRDAFLQLGNDPRSTVQEIALYGLEGVERLIKRGLEEERREELYGV